METKEKPTIAQQMNDIILNISWGHISMDYFHKSRSWLSKKMNGKGFNGGESEFTPEELETLKKALFDLSNRIRETAEKLY